MAEKRKGFEGITSKLGLQPMESAAMVSQKKAKLFIGIPKENSFRSTG